MNHMGPPLHQLFSAHTNVAMIKWIEMLVAHMEYWIWMRNSHSNKWIVRDELLSSEQIFSFHSSFLLQHTFHRISGIQTTEHLFILCACHCIVSHSFSFGLSRKNEHWKSMLNSYIEESVVILATFIWVAVGLISKTRSLFNSIRYQHIEISHKWNTFARPRSHEFRGLVRYTVLECALILSRGFTSIEIFTTKNRFSAQFRLFTKPWKFTFQVQ